MSLPANFSNTFAYFGFVFNSIITSLNISLICFSLYEFFTTDTNAHMKFEPSGICTLKSDKLPVIKNNGNLY